MMGNKRMKPLNLNIGAKIGVVKLFDVQDSNHPRSALVAVGTREEETNQLYVYRVNVVEQEDYDSKIDIGLCRSHSYEEGDIISLSWLGDSFSDGKIMVASSNGGVFLHKKLKVNNTSSTEMEKPETLFDHGGKLACADTFKTGGRNVTVATGGVDSSLKIWDLERGQMLHHFPNVDPIAIRNITYLGVNPNEFCTVGTSLKFWDLRAPSSPSSPSSPLVLDCLPVLDDIKRSYHHPSSSSSASSSFYPSPSPSWARASSPLRYPTPSPFPLQDPSSSSSSSSAFTSSSPTPALTCATPHPRSKHLILTGDEEGNAIGWDVRKQRYPVFWGQHSEAPIWDIKFHPTYPRTFYTCGEDGGLVGWDLKEGGGGGMGMGEGMGVGEFAFPRMGGCSRKVVSQSYLPLNSLDVFRADEGLGILAGGGEGESLMFQFEMR